MTVPAFCVTTCGHCPASTVKPTVTPRLCKWTTQGAALWIRTLDLLSEQRGAACAARSRIVEGRQGMQSPKISGLLPCSGRPLFLICSALVPSSDQQQNSVIDDIFSGAWLDPATTRRFLFWQHCTSIPGVHLSFGIGSQPVSARSQARLDSGYVSQVSYSDECCTGTG